MKNTEIIGTRNGKVQGYIDNGVLIFKGIPYAEPPVGELRLSPPELKKSWSGVLKALEFGPVAPQPPPYLDFLPPLIQNEAECLSLNIWTPSCDDNKRPVMFWIHGGSHITGSGFKFNGKDITRRGDIVLVSINYRLGPLGNFYFPNATANIGMLDQITALEWVCDNIKSFGGDRENITLFGESAGATSIGTLLAVPKAKGLFKRAILQSGVPSSYGYDISKRKKTATLILKELKLKPDDLEEFRKLPSEKIIKAMIKIRLRTHYTDTWNQITFRPWVDGEILPQHPIKAIKEGYAKEIELIVGSNLEEWKFWHIFDPNFKDMDSAKLFKAINRDLRAAGEDDKKTDYIIDTYMNSREENKLPSKPQDIFDAYFTDLIFHIPSIKLAEAQSKHQKNNYMYLFTWRSLFKDYGAMHVLEIPFIFNTFFKRDTFFLPKKTKETEELSKKMMSSWVSFAKTGNPNYNGNLNWPQYDTEKRATMIFDNDIRIDEAPLDKERQMWYRMKMWSKL